MQSPKLLTLLRPLFVFSLLLPSPALFSQTNLDTILQKIDLQKLAGVLGVKTDSFLASLFRIPGEVITPGARTNLAVLQKITPVNHLMQYIC